MNKKVILTSAILGATALAGVAFATGASADDMTTMKSKLAEKLGIEESQVETAMEEMREEKRIEMQAKQEDRLQEAVDAGVLTSEQKDALLTKRAEMREEREQHRAEMETWFEEQEIDHDALMEYQGFGGEGGGRGMHRGMF